MLKRAPSNIYNVNELLSVEETLSRNLFAAIQEDSLRSFLDCQKHQLFSNIMDTPNQEGFTPIMAVIRGDCMEIMEHFLPDLPDLDTCDRRGYTPLLIAAEQGNEKAVDLLLDAGADVLAETSTGESALIIAARRGTLPISNSLLRSGADPATRNKAGKTAADIAESCGHRELSNLLNRAVKRQTVKKIKSQRQINSADISENTAARFRRVETSGMKVGEFERSGSSRSSSKDSIKLNRPASREGIELERQASMERQTSKERVMMDRSNNSNDRVKHERNTSREGVRFDIGLHSKDNVRSNTDGKSRSTSPTEDPMILILRSDIKNMVHSLPDVLSGHDLSELKTSVYEMVNPSASSTLDDLLHLKEEIEVLFSEMNSSGTTENVNGAMLSNVYVTIFQAAAMGDANHIQTCINSNVNVDVLNSNQDSALLIACKNNFLDCVSILFRNGANANIENYLTNETPLIIACKNGNSQLCRVLIENGASVNYRTKSGFTPLFVCLERQNTDVLKIIVSAHPDMTLVGPNNEPPLFTALRVGAGIERLSILKQYGANFTEQFNQISPLAAAVNAHNIADLKILLDFGVDIRCKFGSGSNILLHVARTCKVAVMCDLIFNTYKNAGGSFSFRDNDEISALDVAVLCGNQYVILRLLMEGMDINGGSSTKNLKPLMYAVCGQSTETLEYLIQRGANVNAVDVYGRSALMLACENNIPDFVRILLKANANPKQKSKNGRDAFDFIPVSGGGQTANALVTTKSGNSLIQKTSLEESEYANALIDGVLVGDIDGFVQLIELERGEGFGNVLFPTNCYPHGATPLMAAADVGDIEIVKILLKLEVDVDQRNCFGDTALFFAARSGHKDIVQILILARCDINMRNVKGNTVLIESVVCNFIEIVKNLFQSEININLLNYEGRSALMEAAERNNVAMAMELVYAGADVNLCDRQGNTPLMIAAANNSLDCLILFCEGCKEYSFNFWNRNLQGRNVLDITRSHQKRNPDCISFLEEVAEKMPISK